MRPTWTMRMATQRRRKRAAGKAGRYIGPADLRLRRHGLRHVHGHPRHPGGVGLAQRNPGRPQRRLGRDRLGADGLSHRRSHHDPAVGHAGADHVDPRAVHHLGRGLHRRQRALLDGDQHRPDDRLPRAAGLYRRRHDPVGVRRGFHHLSALAGASIVSPIIGLVATLAPTIGPTVGGYLTSALSWHWLFLINVGPGIIVAIAAWLLIDFDKPEQGLMNKFDWWGLLGMAASSARSNTCSRKARTTTGSTTRRCSTLRHRHGARRHPVLLAGLPCRVPDRRSQGLRQHQFLASARCSPSCSASGSTA